MANIKCCYQCPDRYSGCHSRCKKYKDEKKQWEEDKEKIKEQLKKPGPYGKYAYDKNLNKGIKRHKY